MIKKLLLILPLFALLLFVGANCTQEEDLNVNAEVEDQFTTEIIMLELADGELLVEKDPSWYAIEQKVQEGEGATEDDGYVSDSEVDAPEELTEDEWKGDPTQVIEEYFFTMQASGEALNQVFHIENMQADLKGLIVVYKDGTIGGTGTIAYARDENHNSECIMDMDTSGTMECDLLDLQDGTFSMSGEVVLHENCTENDGLPNGYCLKVFFAEAEMPLEKVELINTLPGGEYEKKDSPNLHTLLNTGPFGEHHLICPNIGKEINLEVNGQYAFGDIYFELVDNPNNAEFNALRETMGLTLQ